MEIKALIAAAACAVIPVTAFAEAMFDQGATRQAANKMTCGEWTAALFATEMKADSPQDFALQGSVLGYVNGVMDALIASENRVDETETLVSTIVAVCSMSPEVSVVNVVAAAVSGQ